ncbi:Transcription termination factor MTERF2, chloroplastic [Linum perenne]
MLSSSYYNSSSLHPLYNRHPISVFSISSSSLLPRHRPQDSPDSPTGDTTPDFFPPSEPISRTHNAKTTSLLSRHLLRESPVPQHWDEFQSHDEVFPLEEHVKRHELSLIATRRAPTFPGSISSYRPDVSTSPLQALFPRCDENEDEDIIIKAVEIRRKVTAEIFLQAMNKGKFGLTYSGNLAAKLGDFLDFVMIQAAHMKRSPDFENSSFNLRAKIVIQDLGVVPLIRWLKHNELSYPKIAKLLNMSRGNLDSVRRIAEWLKSIHVKGEFLGPVLTKAGDNVLERSNEELDEIVEYLESNGVRRDWMGFVMSRCPQLLSYSMDEIRTRVKFFTDMGMNEKDFGTMVFEYSRVLGYFSLDEMNQKVDYLKEFGISHEDVGRLLAFKPQLMGCSIEETWKPLVKYFYYLGITKDGMRRMLMVKPMVFCVDLEKTIVPKVRFFQDIGIEDAAIGNMLVKFPPLLTYSLQKKIRAVVIYLMTRAGVSQTDIAKVIASGPELMGCSIVHKLDINVKYFLSLGIRPRVLGEMVADFPMLLRYSVQVLRPKYQYLRRTMVGSLHDVIEYPRFFSYSLEGRIIPRHKVMVENQMNMKLRYMLACSDEEFEKKVEATLEKRQNFEAASLELSKELQDMV